MDSFFTFGAAEPQEVTSIVNEIRGVAQNWSSFCTTLIEQDCKIFVNERNRAMIEKSQFNDGLHGNIFVITILGAFNNLSGAHRNCALHLISYDPLSTFFILFDPNRTDTPDLNAALLQGALTMKYLDRAKANSEYEQLMVEAANCCKANEIINVLLDIKKGLPYSRLQGVDDDGRIKVFAEIITDCYKQTTSDNKKIYTCLESALRPYMLSYDYFRFAAHSIFLQLFPSSDVIATQVLQRKTEYFTSRINELKAVAAYCLDPTNRPAPWGMRIISDSQDAYSLLHFIRSDFFTYIPLDSSAAGKLIEATKATLEAAGQQYSELAAAGIKNATPINLSEYYKKNFKVYF